MKYVYLNNEDIAQEIIPEKDPQFLGVEIGNRYSREFLDRCVKVTDDKIIPIGWKYNWNTREFFEPELTIITE